VNNSSLTSKRAHVSLASDSSISSGSLRFLQFFPSTALIEFPNVRETEKGLKPPFVLSSYDSFFSLLEHSLTNPNGESVRNWISNNISKFHYNPTVNETRIEVLSRQLWVSAGKKNATMRKVFLSAPTWYQNSQRWECSELGCKLSAQISWRSKGEWVRDRHFSETCLMGCGKKKGFWEKKREKMKLRGRWGWWVSLKTDLACCDL